MYEAERGKATRRVQFDGRVEGEERSFVASLLWMTAKCGWCVREQLRQSRTRRRRTRQLPGSGIRISLFCWGVLRCASDSKVWEMKRFRNENARFYEDREVVNLGKRRHS